jgi:DNA polymerase III subunit chi
LQADLGHATGMTEVSFHTNVPHLLGYTCRLLRKASRQGARVVVTAPAPTLAALDHALWTFEPLDFVPHVLQAAGAAVAERLRATPVWLVERVADAVDHEVLVNLGPEAPEGFESFSRVIELVSIDDEARVAGRQRWKHYASRGYAIQHHEVSE